MKILLLSITLFSFQMVWGQGSYKAIPETETTWIQAQFLYSAYISHEHATITSVVHIEGDTMINGQNYVTFTDRGFADWIDGWGSQQNYNSGTDYMPSVTKYFRQDLALKRVYLWNEATETDELLYDFGSLTIGQPYPQTITNTNYPNLLVLAQDSVQLMDGNYYQRWVLGTNAMDSAYVSVIEGVGGTNGFNSPIYPVFEQSSALLCHKVGSQHIYEDWQSAIIPPRYSEECSNELGASTENQMNLVIYPNPTSGIVNFTSSQAFLLAEVYALDGSLLLRQETAIDTTENQIDLSKLESGIYLVKIVQTNGSIITQKIQLLK